MLLINLKILPVTQKQQRFLSLQQGGMYSLILLKAKNEEKLKEKFFYYCLDQKPFGPN